MATDPDEGAAGDVKYAILSDNVGGIFRLDANSGILYPGASLIGKSGKLMKVELKVLAPCTVRSHSRACYLTAVFACSACAHVKQSVQSWRWTS